MRGAGGAPHLVLVLVALGRVVVVVGAVERARVVVDARVDVVVADGREVVARDCVDDVGDRVPAVVDGAEVGGGGGGPGTTADPDGVVPVGLRKTWQ